MAAHSFTRSYTLTKKGVKQLQEVMATPAKSISDSRCSKLVSPVSLPKLLEKYGKR